MIETSIEFKRFPEHILNVGEGRNLVAIASGAPSTSRAKPAVVMLNAGVLHRIGPHRLHVLLARELASKGFATCRVDLSGIGDSGPIAGDISFRESAVNDTRAVMDGLARESKVERFVIFGLCSGADNALATAEKDSRVAAVVLLDSHSYSTRQSNLRELRRRIANEGLLPPLLSSVRAVSRAFARKLRPPQRDIRPTGREVPPSHEFRQSIAGLLERGTKMLFVYSAAMHERCNHREQLFELFPEFRGRVDVEYFGDADHVFTELAARTRLMGTVVGWLCKAFP